MKIFADKEIKKLFLSLSVIWLIFLMLAQGYLWLSCQRVSLCLLFLFCLQEALYGQLAVPASENKIR